ncbi:PAS domain S-box protein [Tabrizicola piscis]|uniref:histidine kinase n=2 Tax=Tabrizicola piscis TaxID=2494374 RepID=A0A3S8U5T7_9RHOB|nr:PAS domain S-box protein [Tabrizicola piscis]
MVAADPDFSIFVDMPASVMVLDRDLKYVAASRMYLATVGLEMADLKGRMIFDIFPEIEERRKPLEQSMRRALAGEGNGIDRLYYAIPDPDDRTVLMDSWWRCRHNPVVGPDGSVNYMIQITENISDLIRTENMRNAIAHEMQHRVGNLLALVQIVARRTAQNADSLKGFLAKFEERIQSMSRTHSYLVGSNWNRMSLHEIVTRQLDQEREDRANKITISGPEILLDASDAQMLSMAIHELTTNSLKYGALQGGDGRLDVRWSDHNLNGFKFCWIESDVKTIVPSDRTGFGSMILDTIVPAQLRALAQRKLGQDGLRYELTVAERTPSAHAPVLQVDQA